MCVRGKEGSWCGLKDEGEVLYICTLSTLLHSKIECCSLMCVTGHSEGREGEV